MNAETAPPPIHAHPPPPPASSLPPPPPPAAAPAPLSPAPRITALTNAGNNVRTENAESSKNGGTTLADALANKVADYVCARRTQQQPQPQTQSHQQPQPQQLRPAPQQQQPPKPAPQQHLVLHPRQPQSQPVPKPQPPPQAQPIRQPMQQMTSQPATHPKSPKSPKPNAPATTMGSSANLKSPPNLSRNNAPLANLSMNRRVMPALAVATNTMNATHATKTTSFAPSVGHAKAPRPANASNSSSLLPVNPPSLRPANSPRTATPKNQPSPKILSTAPNRPPLSVSTSRVSPSSGPASAPPSTAASPAFGPSNHVTNNVTYPPKLTNGSGITGIATTTTRPTKLAGSNHASHPPHTKFSPHGTFVANKMTYARNTSNGRSPHMPPIGASHSFGAPSTSKIHSAPIASSNSFGAPSTPFGASSSSFGAPIISGTAAAVMAFQTISFEKDPAIVSSDSVSSSSAGAGNDVGEEVHTVNVKGPHVNHVNHANYAKKENPVTIGNGARDPQSASQNQQMGVDGSAAVSGRSGGIGHSFTYVASIMQSMTSSMSNTSNSQKFTRFSDGAPIIEGTAAAQMAIATAARIAATNRKMDSSPQSSPELGSVRTPVKHQKVEGGCGVVASAALSESKRFEEGLAQHKQKEGGGNVVGSNLESSFTPNIVSRESTANSNNDSPENTGALNPECSPNNAYPKPSISNADVSMSMNGESSDRGVKGVLLSSGTLLSQNHSKRSTPPKALSWVDHAPRVTPDEAMTSNHGSAKKPVHEGPSYPIRSAAPVGAQSVSIPKTKPNSPYMLPAPAMTSPNPVQLSAQMRPPPQASTSLGGGMDILADIICHAPPMIVPAVSKSAASSKASPKVSPKMSPKMCVAPASQAPPAPNSSIGTPQPIPMSYASKSRLSPTGQSPLVSPAPSQLYSPHPNNTSAVPTYMNSHKPAPKQVRQRISAIPSYQEIYQEMRENAAAGAEVPHFQQPHVQEQRFQVRQEETIVQQPIKEQDSLPPPAAAPINSSTFTHQEPANVVKVQERKIHHPSPQIQGYRGAPLPLAEYSVEEVLHTSCIVETIEPPPRPAHRAPTTHFGHAGGGDIVEGKELYSRKDLVHSGAHALEHRDVHGNMKEGADSIVISNLERELREGDGLCWLLYSCDRTNGGGALCRSYLKKRAVRVFRSSTLGGKFAAPFLEEEEDDDDIGYRYDGLYMVRAVWDVNGNETEIFPSVGEEGWLTFFFTRLPKKPLDGKTEPGMQYNQLGLQELWGSIQKMRGVKRPKKFEIPQAPMKLPPLKRAAISGENRDRKARPPQKVLPKPTPDVNENDAPCEVDSTKNEQQEKKVTPKRPQKAESEESSDSSSDEEVTKQDLESDSESASNAPKAASATPKKHHHHHHHHHHRIMTPRMSMTHRMSILSPKVVDNLRGSSHVDQRKRKGEDYSSSSDKEDDDGNSSDSESSNTAPEKPKQRKNNAPKVTQKPTPKTTPKRQKVDPPKKQDPAPTDPATTETPATTATPAIPIPAIEKSKPTSVAVETTNCFPKRSSAAKAEAANRDLLGKSKKHNPKRKASTAASAVERKKSKQEEEEKMEEESSSEEEEPIDEAVLTVGSRVLVLYKGSLFKATIRRRREKNGIHSFLIHYDGNKKSNVHWVPLDRISEIISINVDITPTKSPATKKKGGNKKKSSPTTNQEQVPKESNLSSLAKDVSANDDGSNIKHQADQAEKPDANDEEKATSLEEELGHNDGAENTENCDADVPTRDATPSGCDLNSKSNLSQPSENASDPIAKNEKESKENRLLGEIESDVRSEIEALQGGKNGIKSTTSSSEVSANDSKGAEKKSAEKVGEVPSGNGRSNSITPSSSAGGKGSVKSGVDAKDNSSSRGASCNGKESDRSYSFGSESKENVRLNSSQSGEENIADDAASSLLSADEACSSEGNRDKDTDDTSVARDSVNGQFSKSATSEFKYALGSHVYVEYRHIFYSSIILKARKKRSSTEYLVHYEGYKKASNRWVKEDALHEVNETSTKRFEEQRLIPADLLFEADQPGPGESTMVTRRKKADEAQPEPPNPLPLRNKSRRSRSSDMSEPSDSMLSDLEPGVAFLPGSVVFVEWSGALYLGKMIKKRGSGNKMEYFVSYDGFNSHHDAWVSINNIYEVNHQSKKVFNRIEAETIKPGENPKKREAPGPKKRETRKKHEFDSQDDSDSTNAKNGIENVKPTSQIDMRGITPGVEFLPGSTLFAERGNTLCLAKMIKKRGKGEYMEYYIQYNEKKNDEMVWVSTALVYEINPQTKRMFRQLSNNKKT